VVSCPFDADFKAKGASQVTHLFVSRQIHAENHQTHYHLAMRLETMQAYNINLNGSFNLNRALNW